MEASFHVKSSAMFSNSGPSRYQGHNFPLTASYYTTSPQLLGAHRSLELMSCIVEKREIEVRLATQYCLHTDCNLGMTNRRPQLLHMHFWGVEDVLDEPCTESNIVAIEFDWSISYKGISEHHGAYIRTRFVSLPTLS
jgi:hypothetical protein